MARARTRTGRAVAFGAAIGWTGLLVGLGQSPAAAQTAPVAVNDSYSTIRNVPITVPAPGVLANDTDADGDPLTVISFRPHPNSPDVTVNPDGSFTFTPPQDMTGHTHFFYTVSDGQGGTDEGFVGITIDPDPRECGQDFPPKLATILGTEGDDRLVGTEGPDVIVGLGGDDTIKGLGGDDIICGGPGNDDIDGGHGNDYLDGGDGNDRIRGGHGDDAIFAGAGNDDIDGGHGTDFGFAGEGNDRVAGGHGDDAFFGDMGDDTIDGGPDNDTIFGDDGNDLLIGGQGDDTFFAGENFETFDDVDVCDPGKKAPGTNAYFDCEAGAGAPPP